MMNERKVSFRDHKVPVFFFFISLMLGSINPIFAGTVMNGFENYLSAQHFPFLHEFYSSFFDLMVLQPFSLFIFFLAKSKKKSVIQFAKPTGERTALTKFCMYSMLWTAFRNKQTAKSFH